MKFLERCTRVAVFLISVLLLLGIILATALVIFQVVRPWQMTFAWAFWVSALFYIVLIALRATFKD